MSDRNHRRSLLFEDYNIVIKRIKGKDNVIADADEFCFVAVIPCINIIYSRFEL